MNSDFLLEILFQTHYHMSTNGQGFFQQMSTKNFLMPSNQREFEDLVERAFEKFETLPQASRRGSVHLHPDTWVGFLCQTIHNARIENTDVDLVDLPNGCCAQDICPISVFYQCCLDVNPKPTSDVIEDDVGDLKNRRRHPIQSIESDI